MTVDSLNLIHTLDPLGLSNQDLDKLVAEQRRYRALSEAGVKPQKQRLEDFKGSALLEDLKMITKQPPIKRRK